MARMESLGDRPLNKHELQQLLGYVYLMEQVSPRSLRKNITKSRHVRIKQFINREYKARMAEEMCDAQTT